MKLLWNTNKNLNTFWGNYHANNSKDWVFAMLKKINISEIENIEDIHNDDKIIVVDSEISKKNDFYKTILKKTKNIFLIHLGDEGGSENKNFIYNSCIHVWRTFCLGEFFNNKKVTCIPIGYKNGIDKNQKKILDRKYNWSFLGTSHGSSRFDLLFQHKKIKDGFTRTTKEFASKDSLGSAEYYNVISNTKFLPVPHGYYHPETYRLYEGLENGCIPIVENPHKFFDKFYPNNPLLKIELWKESPALINYYLEDKTRIDELSNKIINWWDDYKKNLQNNFREILDV
tara:strand:+ start:2617 stop:3474 length:858 start_codon:yes stop_codon:yes gene_type:complete